MVVLRSDNSLKINVTEETKVLCQDGNIFKKAYTNSKDKILKRHNLI